MIDVPVVSTPLPKLSGLTPPHALRTLSAMGDGDYVLLHTGTGGASVLGFDPLMQIWVDGAGGVHVTGIADEGGGGPLEALERVIRCVKFNQPHGMVGWLGFVGYDVARFLERISQTAGNDAGWPILWFTLFRRYVVFENGTATGHTLGESTDFEWDMLLRGGTEGTAAGGTGVVLSGLTAEAYMGKVERVKKYIAAGDIYQANLAQRWRVKTSAAPEVVFEKLCAISPAPFASCMRVTCGGRQRHVVSASPELFVEVREEDGERVAVTRPIKGTRPRDLQDGAQDAALRQELEDSAKDRAELNMIVDLLRNDLGRVSTFGSVQVREPRAMEAHPTVWHTVATIQSRLRAETGLADLLRALCPGGSITGAPKIRAMQIIEELEGFRRELYCGNIGMIGNGGRNLTLNIAIRTILLEQGIAHVYAGGGVVADSDPRLEYEETLHKARAMFAALGVVA